MNEAETSAPIRAVRAREVFDCRLEPTLRVTVETEGGSGTADVPAGRSTGRHEAVERRDGGERFGGRGVREAVATAEGEVSRALDGVDAVDGRGVDDALLELDGTDRKERLGGNVTTGVSLAAARAAAEARGVPLYRHVAARVGDGVRLPYPVFDMIEGGELADSPLDFQEHQLVPVGADSVAEAIRMAAETYAELGDLLAARYGTGACALGVEGGYTPAVEDPTEAFDALLEAAERAGYADDVVLSVDAAATHLYDAATVTYRVAGERLAPDELLDYYVDLCERYPLESIEDPFHEDDFDRTAALTAAADAQIVGDDLFVTNEARVREGAAAGAGSALLLKVNQAGTLSEALDAASAAREAGFRIQVSERSGQTPDTWLADLAVGLDAGQIKTGVTRGERTEQYNRLLEIESELDDPAVGRW
jgi:enolase